MNVRLLTTDADLTRYEAWVRSHPQGTLWQSLVRKRYLEACGKEVRIYGMYNGKWIMDNGRFSATALVVIDQTMGGYSTWEIPRGPLWTSQEAGQQLVQNIVEDAKHERCIALYVSPTIPLTQLSIINYQLSIRHVHAQATRIIDLTPPEEAILAQMHPKGRYNIGVARRHGVEILQGTPDDVPVFYALLKETAKRDGFTISPESHYTRFLSTIEGSLLLMAKHAGRAIGGLLGVAWNGTVIYYYGASSFVDRALMAPYLLQWEAMRRYKAAGCTSYDLLGIENKLSASPDPWAGISEFKRKFGGTVVTYPAEQMLVLRPWVHKALRLKRALLG